jgi:hypothetical protein
MIVKNTGLMWPEKAACTELLVFGLCPLRNRILTALRSAGAVAMLLIVAFIVHRIPDSVGALCLTQGYLNAMRALSA